MSTGVQGSRFTFLDVGMTILKLKQRLTIGSSHYLSGLPVHTQYGVAVHPLMSSVPSFLGLRHFLDSPKTSPRSSSHYLESGLGKKSVHLLLAVSLRMYSS